MAEIKHKLMRNETLLDILNRCFGENRSRYQETFQQQVLGMIVLTRYNNKTYRISDVLFNATPLASFETKTGPITYVDYYKTVGFLAEKKNTAKPKCSVINFPNSHFNIHRRGELQLTIHLSRCWYQRRLREICVEQGVVMK